MTGRLMEKLVTNNDQDSQWNQCEARTSPGSDAQNPRPSSVVSMRGLPRVERPRPKKLARMGTLNVGTMTGRSREVADLMKRRRIQVLCLQETRWKGAKAREIGDGVKLYYNGKDTKRNGVGIAVAESLKDPAAAVQRINDRIMSLRLDTKEGY
ncbi:unnamed protein product [Heligmosomoides polygyrus]|uniref:Endo/exonuclease/phosphatase domain-containing protein n=1 Tax=Heligmosomoides polygyrus TaxID=6339 RepID=A0A183GXE3_HELPZ|nr:unnamed protein product [Heligmosomoides polygyrus]